MEGAGYLAQQVSADSSSDTPPFKYKAFLSYSSRDATLAKWLIDRLEGWRTPRELVGKANKFGTKVPETLGRICRDRDEFPTAAFIDSIIKEKLSQCEQLIVLCSDSAAHESSYVDREVGWFAVVRPGGQLHAMLNGRPPGCFPPRLKQSPPLAGSFLPPKEGGDGRERAFVKLVAGLLGVDFDDLWQRERRRQAWRKGIWAGASVVMVGALALLAYVAIGATIESIDRQKEVVASESARAALASSRDIARLTNWSSEGLTLPIAPNFSGPLLAAVKAAESYQQNPNEIPSVVFGALREVLRESPPWEASLKHAAQPVWVEWSPTGQKLLTASIDGNVSIWTLGNAEPAQRLRWGTVLNGRFEEFNWHFGWCGEDIIAGDRIHGAGAGHQGERTFGPHVARVSSCSPQADQVLLVMVDGSCEVRRLKPQVADTPVRVIGCSSIGQPIASSWSNDSRSVAIASGDAVLIVDSRSGVTSARLRGALIGWSNSEPLIAILSDDLIRVFDMHGRPALNTVGPLRFSIVAGSFLSGHPDPDRWRLLAVSPDLRHAVATKAECTVGMKGGICSRVSLNVVQTTMPSTTDRGDWGGERLPDGLGADSFPSSIAPGSSESQAIKKARTLAARGYYVRHLDLNALPTRLMYGHVREPTMASWSPDGSRVSSIAGLNAADQFFSVLRPQEDNSAIVFAALPLWHGNGSWHKAGVIPIQTSAGKAIRSPGGSSAVETVGPRVDEDPVPMLHLPSAAKWSADENAVLVAFDVDDCNACRHGADPLPVLEHRLDAGVWAKSRATFRRSDFFDADRGALGPMGELKWAFRGRDSWQYGDDDRPKRGTKLTLDHPGLVSTARWSPDGLKVLTACQDGFARVWNGSTGRLLAELSMAQRAPNGARIAVDMADWSPSGRLILLFSADYGIQVEYAELGAMLSVARARLRAAPPPGLTREQADLRETER